MAKRDSSYTALTAWRTSSQTRHFGVCSRLINENQRAGIETGLSLNPNLPLRRYIGALSFSSMRSLFLCVIRRRSKKRQSVPMPALTPRTCSFS